MVRILPNFMDGFYAPKGPIFLSPGWSEAEPAGRFHLNDPALKGREPTGDNASQIARRKSSLSSCHSGTGHYSCESFTSR